MWRKHVSQRAPLWLMVAIVCALAPFSIATSDDGTPTAVSLLTVSPDAETTPAAMAASVSVTADRDHYQPGEPILVTISNGLTVPVYAPPQGGCSIVSVLRLVDGQWVGVGSCPTPNVTATEILPMTDLTRVLGPATQAPHEQGPVVIGPVAPSISQHDVGTLPTAIPWMPGDPIRVVPEGAVAAPFSVTDSNLDPGTYRVEFTFGLGSGSASDNVRTVRSEAFVITS